MPNAYSKKQLNTKELENTKIKKLDVQGFSKVVWWVLKFNFRLFPITTIFRIIFKVFLQNSSLIQAFIIAKIFDEAIKISQMPTPVFTDLYLILGVFLLFETFVRLIESVNNYIYTKSKISSHHSIDTLLFEHIKKLGVQAMENPSNNDLLLRTKESMYDSMSIFSYVLNIFAIFSAVMASSLIIFSFLPFMVPLLFAVTILTFIPVRIFSKKQFEWKKNHTTSKRKCKEIHDWITSPSTIKEISLLNAYKYFQKKYFDFFDRYNFGLFKIIKGRYSTEIGVGFLSDFTTILGTALIIFQFIGKEITFGILTFRVQTLRSFTRSLSDLLDEVTLFYELAIKTKDVVDFFELKPPFTEGEKSLPKLSEAPEIEFKNMSFSYPNSKRKIIPNLNLKIKKGEKIAIVGHNGAGKSTLVKLLAKIYLPKSGEILINGVSLSKIKTDDWYKNLGVLFQEFNIYGHLSVKENIAIGDPEEKADFEYEIIKAAKNADAHEFIMDLPEKYDQILSESYSGGIKPSGGQGQKISIARFFYRDAPVILFDEPTSAIDAVSEYNIFTKIYQFFTNKTVIIISHRFSTVRNADRIIVLDKGSIAEEGTHRELLALRGIYYNSFKLQAEGYKK